MSLCTEEWSLCFEIDALLPKVKPRYTRFAPLDKFLLDLHTFLTSLPSTSSQHPLLAASALLKKGVAVPYLNPPPTEDTNWKVAFDTPQEVSLVGTWNTKLAVKRKDGLPYVVDVAVQMPDVSQGTICEHQSTLSIVFSTHELEPFSRKGLSQQSFL